MTRNGISWERLRELDEANPREHAGEHVCVDGRRYVSDCWVLAWHRGEHRLRPEYEARHKEEAAE